MLGFIKESAGSQKVLFTGATFMIVVLKACAVAPALLLGMIIDNLNSGAAIDTEATAMLLLSFASLIVAQSVIHPLQTYQLTKLVQTTIKEKSVLWTKNILNKEFGEFSSLRLGGLIKSVERGITAHEKLLTFFVTTGIPLIVETLLIGGVFFYIGEPWVFCCLVTVSFVYLLISHHLINWRRPHLSAVNLKEDVLATRLFETLHAGKSIKLERAVDSALSPLCESFSAYADAAIKVASSGALLSSTKILFIGLSTCGLLTWGIVDQLSVEPTLSVGKLVAMFSIAGSFLVTVSGLSDAYRTLDQFLVDKRRLQELLSLPELSKNKKIGDFPITRLSLSFHHAKNTLATANTVLSFNASESVAIVGPSGSGKTTLLETLAGLVKERRPNIKINDKSTISLDTADFYDRVRYCPQNPCFLEGKFWHSVLFGREQSTQLSYYIDKLELREIVDHRKISEGAKNISGGEAKRLSLLRLINRPGHFNLFDEPTSSLDHETSVPVWEALFSAFHNKGFICVTHDINMLSLFDRVIVIQEGQVVADDRWENIMHKEIVRESIKK